MSVFIIVTTILWRTVYISCFQSVCEVGSGLPQTSRRRSSLWSAETDPALHRIEFQFRPVELKSPYSFCATCSLPASKTRQVMCGVSFCIPFVYWVSSLSQLSLFVLYWKRSLTSVCSSRATRFVNAIIRVFTNKQNASWLFFLNTGSFHNVWHNLCFWLLRQIMKAHLKIMKLRLLMNMPHTWPYPPGHQAQWTLRLVPPSTSSNIYMCETWGWTVVLLWVYCTVVLSF